MSKMSERRRLLFSLFEFPQEPTSYNHIKTYNEGGVFTWYAPSNGYYQIEVQGASGAGGEALQAWSAGGGGGGGGGCAISQVKLNKDDKIELYVSYSGYTTYAVINSSIKSYDNPTVTSGADGGKATVPESGNTGNGGAGGAGGRASGGTEVNVDGKQGDPGVGNPFMTGSNGGAGGEAGYPGGNVGGAGSNSKYGSTPGGGKTGFIKIYAGNYNQ